MKRWIGIALLAAGLVTAVAGTLNVAEAQQGGQITTVRCIGTICGRSGGTCGTMYAYRVKAGSTPISQVDIGTHAADSGQYQNVCAPPGWIHSIVAVARPHDPAPTAHGVVTGKSGNCTHVIRFSGPALSGTFDLGFDLNWDFHDVNWKTSDGRQAGWTFPLGDGSGPVHGPLMP
jgi:hypothetical protein